MNHTYHIKMHAALGVMLCAVCLASFPANAELKCESIRTYCPGTGWVTSSCDSTENPCSSDDSGGSSSSPSYDYGAAQRAREAEAAAAAERQRQQDEADRIERERVAAEKRRKDAEFIRDRDAVAGTLKGSSDLPTSQLKGIFDTGLKGGGDNPYGLKDAVSDTGLKGSTPTGEVQTKQAAAWKQLHCAASIAKYALAALQTKGDFGKFGTLSVEASRALDGQRINVECEQAPAFPNLNGKTVDMDRVIASERQVLTRATVIAERMKLRGDAPSTSQQAVSKPPANETPDEKMRRVQRELNQVNSQKTTGKTQQEINQQERDRKELANLILANNRLENGEFTSVIVDVPKEDTSPSRRRNSVPAPR